MSLLAMKQALDLLQKLQWSDHHYDPAHGHSYACPICGGCGRHGDLRSVTSFYGHSKTCRFAAVGKELWQAIERVKEVRPAAWLCCVPGQDAVLLFDEPSDERYPPGYKEALYLHPPTAPAQRAVPQGYQVIGWIDRQYGTKLHDKPAPGRQAVYVPSTPTAPAQPLSYDQVKSEFSKHYPKDLPLIELAENNRDFRMDAIGAYHHLTAFDLGVKAAEAAHGIK